MGAASSNAVCQISIPKSFTFTINERNTTSVAPGIKRVTIPEIKDEDFQHGSYLLKFGRPKKLGLLQVCASGTEIEYSGSLKDLCISFEHFDRRFVNNEPATDVYKDPKSGWSLIVTIKLAKNRGVASVLT